MMRSYKLWIIAATLLVSVHVTSAQESKFQELKPVMNLAECIDYAQRHSPLLLPLEAQVEMLEIEYGLAREAFLPSLNASVGENISFGRSQGKDFTYQDVSSANTTFQVGADITLFNGLGRWHQLKKSDLARSKADYIIAETVDNIALNVAESYVQLLLAKQMAATARENLALTQQRYEEVKQQVQVGKMAVAQQIDIESQIGRDQLSVTETEADVVRARRLLLINMGVRPSQVDIDGIDFAEVTPEQVIARLQSIDPHRVDITWTLPGTARIQRELELSEYDIKIARSRYWPTLSLSGGYSNGYYYMFGEGFPGENAPFGDQMKQNGRSYLGFTLQIPIYNRGQVRSGVRQAELQQISLQSQLIQQQYADERNITLAETDLQKAQEQYRVAGENVTLSQRSLDIADTQYRAGRISTYEWEQAKNRRLQAQASYLQSVYTMLIRTINLTYFHTGELPASLAQ